MTSMNTLDILLQYMGYKILGEMSVQNTTLCGYDLEVKGSLVTLFWTSVHEV